MRKILITLLLFSTDILYSQGENVGNSRHDFTPSSTQYYIVKSTRTFVYLRPSLKSDILKKVSFGQFLKREVSVKKKKGWVYVSDIERLAGWIRKEDITSVNKNNKYKVLIHELNRHMANPHLSFFDWEKIADYLLSITEDADFTGDQFLYLKAKAGIALHRMLNQYSTASDQFKKKHSFIKKKYADYLKDYGGEIYLDADYFWLIAEMTSNASEYAGFLAVKYYNNAECNNAEASRFGVYCSLKELKETKIKYISLFFNGNYARRFSMDIQNKLNELLQKKDYCSDFEKSKSVLLEIKKVIVDIPIRYAAPINSQVEIFLEDCSPQQIPEL